MQAGKHRSRRAITPGQPPLPPKKVGIGGIQRTHQIECQPPDLRAGEKGDYRDRRPLGFGGTPLVRATEARVRATVGGGRRGAAPPISAFPWHCLALREARLCPYTYSRAAAASLVGGRAGGGSDWWRCCTCRCNTGWLVAEACWRAHERSLAGLDSRANPSYHCQAVPVKRFLCDISHTRNRLCSIACGPIIRT